MIDIHYHLIFGVDDGPQELEASLELAEASIAEGVTHIVATPHANDRYPYRPELNRERIAIIQERLAGRLTLGIGCDFHLSYENIIDLEQNSRKYTINETQYLLVEFPDTSIAPGMDDVFYRMLSTGVVPIITHPERNPILMKHPQRLDPWIHMGCFVQITAASLDERFGRRSQEMALELIRKNQVHVIASDAHSMQKRPPAMATAFSITEKKFGYETAQRLCVTNPKAIFEGKPLPYYDPGEEINAQRAGNRGFWSRLFGGR